VRSGELVDGNEKYAAKKPFMACKIAKLVHECDAKSTDGKSKHEAEHG